MRYVTSLFLFLWCTSVAYAQDSPDANEEALEEQRNSLYRKYLDKDYLGIIKLADSVKRYSERENNDFGIYLSAIYLGLVYDEAGDYEKALEVYEEQLYKSLQDDTYPDRQLTAAINVSNTYKNLEQYDKAVETIQRFIPLAEKAEDPLRVFGLVYNMAEVYEVTGEYEKGQPYLERSQKLLPTLTSGWKEFYGVGFEILSAQYAQAAGDYKAVKQHAKSALDQANGSEDLIEQQIEAHNLLAVAHRKLGERDEALGHYEAVYKLYDQQQSSIAESSATVARAGYELTQAESELAAESRASAANKELAEENRLLFLLSSLVAASFLFLLLLLARSFMKRRKLNEQLKQENAQYLQAKNRSEELARVKTQFLSDITHELRTPLYGIIGLSTILQDDKTLVTHREQINSLKFSADYLLSLVNGVLQINKLDSGKNTEINTTQVNLNDLVNNILKSFAFINDKNQNRFEVSLPDSLSRLVWADETKLSQVLFNIVGNACKFTEKGVVKVSVQLLEQQGDKGMFRFHIQDNGIGIAPDKQQEIFNEFSQVIRNPEYEGTGLGLPIAKKLINLMGSDVHLESTLGQGTTIHFDVELTLGLDIPDHETTPVKQKASLDGLVVMVVDDNKVNRLVTGKMLEKNNATCYKAASGQECLDLIAKHKVDLVLMDIHMPEMDGFATSKKLREQGYDKPIIALTAVDVADMRARIEQSAMNDIIIKPFAEETFTNKILEHAMLAVPMH